ncbi:bifunctional protein-serine/threonine kinase/phosphatase [Paraglaciecola aquimarina]|uniref:Bifunctional protein-serine/threonine kinase/phosphatase n=1 Tax=Paraglaciecola aquimarina TaxID=1235557 RepID=A0ABU3SXX0_9ALTE|nr:bifunctional protein-serine/threonine kinase/phosphatase [Paraglaciecola aquimarina]MDU0354845.1 bifunctional protein-serine/threonine kinase/phosphatase [Paraglaciecola aquimarina]
MEKLKLEFGGFSSQGPKAENQDAFAAFLPKDHDLESKGAVATIADGVSVATRAREAANTCVTNFIQDYYQTPQTWTVKRSVSQVLQGLNRWCHGQHDYEHGGHSQMITTFSGMVFKSTSGFIVHSGDTRISRLQGHNFEQLTIDHVSRQGSKNVLTRAVGIDSHLDVDYRTLELERGDIYVFTSDGVHEFLAVKQLSAFINEHNVSLEQRAKNIVDAAVQAGSDDNVTCLLVKVVELPDASLDEHYRQLSRLAMPPALEVGMKLEGYRVVKTVFNGTRSSLFKVLNEADGKIYGLKTPSQYFADDPTYLSGFLREEWIGQHIKHPNVMAIYKRPADAKFMYHICEYIEGQTLRQWMVDNPHPSLQQVRSIIGHLVNALRVLQRKDMVHRDVKPENVMINEHGEVKLIDFGTVLANALAETNSLPDENMAVGSVHYIAPEYLLTHKSDHQSDLFSVAAVIYEMLAGQRPFKAFKYQDYIPSSYDEWQYQSINRFRPDLPKWLDMTLQKALQANPKLRHEAFSELLMDLSKPNQQMLTAKAKEPLIKRNPLLVYQGLCVIQFLVIAFLLAK